jgi:hypothetical protein
MWTDRLFGGSTFASAVRGRFIIGQLLDDDGFALPPVCRLSGLSGLGGLPLMQVASSRTAAPRRAAAWLLHG